MKTQLVYTESDLETFYDFIAFLGKLCDELTNEYELTHERAEILDKAKNLIYEITYFFPVEDN